MGEIQQTRSTRRNPRLEATKKTPRSDGKKKRAVDEVDRCSRRSLSSPPYNTREFLSESQSGSEFDDLDDSTDMLLNNFQTPPEKVVYQRINRSSPTYPTTATTTTEVHEYVSEASGHSPAVPIVNPSRAPIGHRKKKKDDETHPVWIYVGIGTCVFTVALFIIFVVKFEPGINTKAAKPKTLGDVEDDILRDLEKLKAETDQGKRFWGEVFSGLLTLTEPSPRQPAVLLLAVPQDGRRTAVCLAHHISDIVHQAFEDTVPPVTHDTRDHLQLAWDEHKLVLDNELSQLGKAHAAVIYNLELLPTQTATILHGYCDNDNAPYKRSVLLLLLELPVHESSLDPRHLDMSVERRLHQLWKMDMEEDHIPGLMSRVTSQIMMVHPEGKAVLDTLCPL